MMVTLITFSVRHRWAVLGLAAVLLCLGALELRQLPVDVLPDLTRPTVTVLTEAPGLAPEEVEALVTVPIEQALLGVAGLERLRSVSEVGLSQVMVEFAWSADLTAARARVTERLAAARERLPAGVSPGLTPATSLLGNILLVAVVDPQQNHSASELRELVEVRLLPRLQSIPGLAEAVAQGGGLRELRIEPDPERLLAHAVSFEEVRVAAAGLVHAATGGLLESGSRELLIRPRSVTTDLATLGATPVRARAERIVTLAEVATLTWATAPARGQAGAGWRTDAGDTHAGPGVIISLTKAPGFDTLALTRQIETALAELGAGLPAGLRIVPLYRQADFIGLALGNLRDALRDGSAMVAVLLLLLLLNLRVALITLTAIPLSLAGTLLTFSAFGLTVNAMTLGGLAVAVGLVVDDAIVDIENIHRRLRENAAKAVPLPREPVLVRAAGEVRASILFATLLVLLAFVPLLGLHGIEGRLFAPIAIATMVCLAVSFVVALTVVPAAAAVLIHPRHGLDPRPPIWVRGLQSVFAATCLRPALAQPFLVVALAFGLIGGAFAIFLRADRQFLPGFREPTTVIATTTAPGTSLGQTDAFARVLQERLLEVPEVRTIGYRAGRAERGDHVVPVSTIEFDLGFDPAAARGRAAVHADLRAVARTLPGTYSVISSPLADRIGHLLSGVAAPVVVKIQGPEIEELRRLGDRALELAGTIPGLAGARAEPNLPVPQWRLEVDRDRAGAHGLTAGAVQEPVARLLAGEVVGTLQDGARALDVVVRLPEVWREDPARLRALPVTTPEGRQLPLGSVASLRMATGPAQIVRDGGVRRLALSATPEPQAVAAAATAWQEAIEREVPPPPGYTWSFEGSHVAERAATQRLQLLAAGLFVIVTLLVWWYFRSVRLTLLVLFNLPLALVGGILLHHQLVGVVSVATLVGLIAVAGISARNTIMLLSHYLHLMRHEGEAFGPALVIRGTRERLIPVLLTALSAALALLPILIHAEAPGKELLHPIAAVLVGGLISSTLLGLAVTPTVFLNFLRTPAERSVQRQSPAAS